MAASAAAAGGCAAIPEYSPIRVKLTQFILFHPFEFNKDIIKKCTRFLIWMGIEMILYIMFILIFFVAQNL